MWLPVKNRKYKKTTFRINNEQIDFNLEIRVIEMVYGLIYFFGYLKPLDTFGTEQKLKFTDLQITYRVYRR